MVTRQDATRVASSVPGRMRLRGERLRDSSVLEQLSGKIARWRHVSAVDANPRTGSLLVHYDAARLKPDVFASRISKAIAGQHRPKAPGASQPPAHGGTPRVRINRYAKRGMLISLAASLVLAGAGRKRWHALIGGAFLASLALHLWVHRRHILR